MKTFSDYVNEGMKNILQEMVEDQEADREDLLLK